MIFHHTLSYEMLKYENIYTLISDYSILTPIISMARVCVAGFSFISAYGITRKLINDRSHFIKTIYLHRIFEIYKSFIPIFIVGLLGTLIWGDIPINHIYQSSNGSFFAPYAVIDSLGLAYPLGTPTINMTWWYISASLLIVITTPIFYYIYKKIGIVSVIFSFAFLLIKPLFIYTSLVPIIFVGIYAASNGTIEKINNFIHKNVINHILFYILCGLLLVGLFWGTRYLSVEYFFIFLLIIVLFISMDLHSVKPLRICFEFLGMHSTNIYYLHTFIFYYWFRYTIYKFHYSLMIVVAVLIISLLLSLLVELTKIVIHKSIEAIKSSHQKR